MLRCRMARGVSDSPISARNRLGHSAFYYMPGAEETPSPQALSRRVAPRLDCILLAGASRRQRRLELEE
jgi:hypothetical protein